MFKIPMYLLILSVLMGGVVTAQAPDASIAKATAEYEEWMDVMVEFTRGVEIDEGDIQNFLEFWPEMDDLEVMNREDETDSAAEFATDVGEILAAPEYQAWARGNGLDPEGWLRKSMRVATLLIAQQMEAQREMMASQRESYTKMVEESCAQVDEETCQQMRAGMAQSMALSEVMISATAKLPPATSGEAVLLDQYGAELQALMMGDDEEEFDEYYSDYDEDYDEDDG